MSDNLVRRRKISLIGSGNIGGVMGYFGTLSELGDIVLFDIRDNISRGKALDILHANSISAKPYNCRGTGNYEDIAGSDVCIVTAGLTRPTDPNQEWSRDALIEMNSKIIKQVGENIKKHAPNAFVIVITNPMDVMVDLMLRVTGFKKNMVVGMGGLLDTSRMCYYIAEKLGVNPKYVHGNVIGAHGDSMIPLVKRATVNGIPILDLVEQGFVTMEDLKAIEERTIKSGLEVLDLLGQGSAFFAPATAAIEMASAYLNDKKSIFPCSAYLSGEYGYNDVFCGTPAIIGAGGVEKVIEVKLSEEEQKRYDFSITEIRRLQALMK